MGSSRSELLRQEGNEAGKAVGDQRVTIGSSLCLILMALGYNECSRKIILKAVPTWTSGKQELGDRSLNLERSEECLK